MQNNQPRNLRNPVALMLSLFLPLCLHPTPASSAETTAEALTRIEAETLVMKAEERQLAIKTKILQLQAEITARQASADQNARPGAPGDPTVQSIEGIGDALHATLQFENGSSIDVKMGDTLPNGMRILLINTNEVVVSADKRKNVRLLPGTAAVVAAASGGVQTTMALPTIVPNTYSGTPALPGGSGVPRLPVKVPGKGKIN